MTLTVVVVPNISWKEITQKESKRSYSWGKEKKKKKEEKEKKENQNQNQNEKKERDLTIIEVSCPPLLVRHC